MLCEGETSMGWKDAPKMKSTAPYGMKQAERRPYQQNVSRLDANDGLLSGRKEEKMSGLDEAAGEELRSSVGEDGILVADEGAAEILKSLSIS
jgi:hypothetical protein